MFSKEITRYFSRHLVGLGVEWKHFETGKHELSVMSGFVVEVAEDVWIWVTAGHCIEEIREARKHGLVVQTRFLDGFGTGAVHKEPLIVSLDTCPVWYIYSESTGVDMGFLMLPNLVRQGLGANKIEPMKFGDWRFQEGVEFDGYCLCGVVQEQVEEGPTGFTVKNVFFPIGKEESPPATVKKEMTRFYANVPRFVEFDSIVGMSGGPLFAFKKTEEGLRCWVSAIQCEWDKTHRVLAACPATIFGPVFEEALARFLAGDPEWQWLGWPDLPDDDLASFELPPTN